jgi:hypothetical protein
MPERDQPHVVRPDAEAQGDRSAAAHAPLRDRIDAIDHEIVALLNSAPRSPSRSDASSSRPGSASAIETRDRGLGA